MEQQENRENVAGIADEQACATRGTLEESRPDRGGGSTTAAALGETSFPQDSIRLLFISGVFLLDGLVSPPLEENESFLMTLRVTDDRPSARVGEILERREI